jgi:hypothetical protein
MAFDQAFCQKNSELRNIRQLYEFLLLFTPDDAVRGRARRDHELKNRER